MTPGVQCWQRPGFRHNKSHWDPSQTIRLMHRSARLIHPDGTEEKIDLHDIAGNPALAYLLHHQGPLTYLRQKGVTQLNSILVPAMKPKPVPITIPFPIPVPEPGPISESKPRGPLQAILAFLMSLIGHK